MQPYAGREGGKPPEFLFEGGSFLTAGFCFSSHHLYSEVRKVRKWSFRLRLCAGVRLADAANLPQGERRARAGVRDRAELTWIKRRVLW